MSTISQTHQAFHRGTSPIFSLLSAEQTKQLAELQGDETLARRLEELAERANEGKLTEEEKAEYEGYIDANNILAILQAEARYRLSHRNS